MCMCACAYVCMYACVYVFLVVPYCKSFQQHKLSLPASTIHVYSTPAKLVVKEEKKENPDPIHHTQTVQTRKHTMTRTPECPALRTGMNDF